MPLFVVFGVVNTFIWTLWSGLPPLAFAAPAVACSGGLIFRVASIDKVLRTGARARGVITGLVRFKDRAYLTFAFDVGGTEVATTNFVHQSSRVKALGQGQRVDIAYLPERPQRAYVLGIFI